MGTDSTADDEMIADHWDPLLYSEVVSSVRRATLWFSSLVLEWGAGRNREYEAAALLLMRLQGTNARAVVTLAETSIEHVPAALAASRSCFEAGLTCAWLLGELDAGSAPVTEAEILRRWLGLHDEARGWMAKVARDATEVGFDDTAARWRDGAERRARLLAVASKKLELDDATPIKRPNVAQLCERAGLSRLYHSYRLSSQFTHGTLMGAEEFSPRQARGGMAGPVADDWLLPLSMVVWGFQLSEGAYARRPLASSEPINDAPLWDAARGMGIS
jgi:hypothetical protein